jgi:hypothetical protein
VHWDDGSHQLAVGPELNDALLNEALAEAERQGQLIANEASQDG